MQPLRKFTAGIEKLADPDHYLFSLRDLSALLPELSLAAFKAVLGRGEKNGLLQRVCRGLYVYPKVAFPRDLVLYHAAARLRAHEFNYISLESALSDAGIISQIPLQWLTLKSSGRSHIVDCADFGKIEFVHTKKKPSALISDLVYDERCRLWRASVALALKDMVSARRSMELIDMEAISELA